MQYLRQHNEFNNLFLCTLNRKQDAMAISQH